MRVFVTGGTGFIGSHLLRRLAAGDDWEAFALARHCEDTDAIAGHAVELIRMPDAGDLLAEIRDVEIKLILIGLGDDVDKDQLERFDDMFEGTDLEDDIDIWSHGLVADIKNEDDILGILFGELMDEKKIVAPSGKILDSDGNVVVTFADGLPGKFTFMLPASCTSFTLQAGGREVVQDLSSAL